MDSHKYASMPLGLRLFHRIPDQETKAQVYRAFVLILTFLAYTLFHASRKPPSVVKNVLSSDDSFQLTLNSTTSMNHVNIPWPLNMIYIRKPTIYILQSNHSLGEAEANNLRNGWAPFDGDSGTSLLGDVDVAFLATYAMGMYVAGQLGDRLDLRWFLSGGMMTSGIFVCLFGLAYWLDIHWLPYFFIVQVFGGFVQASGWPSVVTVVGNWFGKSKRGFIMGVWNAHTSVGNILGTLMASSVLQFGWGWSFIVPGISIIIGGIIIFFFLPVDPESVGLPSPHNYDTGVSETKEPSSPDEESGYTESRLKQAADDDEKTKPLIPKSESNAVGFCEAWTIPRVAPFAFCLFFAKLVAYTFLYWLPYYIKHTEINGEYLSDTTAGNLSTLFDIGGTLGGILAGYISDKLNARAIVAAGFTYSALPALLLYRLYGSQTFLINGVLLFLSGICVNGPYALITTAVAADLGTHGSLQGNSKALATVTAIIDGTGSVGAAIGPLLTGYLSSYGWNSVFVMLMLSAVVSGLLLTSLVIEEIREIRDSKLSQVRSRNTVLV